MGKVIVTGGVGFIGLHIVEALEQHKHDVKVLDNAPISLIWGTKIKRENYFYCDIRNFKDVDRVFRYFQPEYVIHCAALARIQPSLANPVETYATNAMGTAYLLEISKRFGVKKFIYSASSSVYGNNTKMPLKESMKPCPLNPYAYSKLMAEMLLEQYVKNFGLRACSLRYFNVYGPRQPEKGQYATIIGIFLRQWHNQKPFTVVTNEYNGHQRRDYTYVSDVVRANILAMESDKVGDGEVINIGSGKNYSVWEVAELIAGGKNYKWKKADDRFGEAKETLADISKAKKLLDWEPKISLEEGIEILKKKMK